MVTLVYLVAHVALGAAAALVVLGIGYGHPDLTAAGLVGLVGSATLALSSAAALDLGRRAGW